MATLADIGVIIAPPVPDLDTGKIKRSR